ncbi:MULTISPECIES: type I-E CRISPR-associated protein Cse1/CasA [Thiorhodovibrio]|uniref:type I-E CRISPR-associated protein Cse1/CasA n=1 Tax=Thiorhodovibrio TaxID=61593 RepID=UPI00191261B3|nr:MULTISPECIES: type I-E CRISPR-associated protein Cse1/CasA [Thiorhodovibrio]MBK5968113.1 type I-E CRISPR-associated protein Cse1/CasA [Thiorhodovibrio winogradskyi]WPL12702.1 CRISPR-associated protein CasA/Cse1 [Thiorhodovibrio litoralis]
MDLLSDSWIPVRLAGGTGTSSKITFRSLLCFAEDLRVALPRDDLELACLQLLVCMTQAIFPAPTIDEIEDRIETPLTEAEFDAAVAPFSEWFVLDHPKQPFMQSPGVQSKEITPIQKLMIGLPEGNNHCFFNQVGEVKQVSAAVAAIVLFNQANNCPSFGGGFKGSLRGAAPITTLVDAPDLRRQVWSNVLADEVLDQQMPHWRGLAAQDHPTWIDPIPPQARIAWNQIGLRRGLFWQPARVALIAADEPGICDVLGTEEETLFTGFRKEKFNFSLEGVWPHPHGSRAIKVKTGKQEEKFASFTTDAPAWTNLAELVIRQDDPKGGQIPPAPVLQAGRLELQPLHLLVGGYRNNQASITERRHELFTLGRGWIGNEHLIREIVDIALGARKALRGQAYFAAQGHRDKELQGLGVPIHEVAQQRFHERTRLLILDIIAAPQTYADWANTRATLIKRLTDICRRIFNELTEPYRAKPELIPIIAWARRNLNRELKKLREDA